MSSSHLLLETGCGIGQENSSFEAGCRAAAQAVSAITAPPLSVVIVFASVRYDLEEALRGVRSVTGATPLIGVTTAGEICNGLHRESITVTVLASPYLQVRFAVSPPVSPDWRSAVEQVVGDPELAPYFSLSGETDRDLNRQGKSLFGVIFSPGNTRAAASSSCEILAFLKQRSLGRIPFFGGSAADDWRMERNFVLADDRAVADALLVAVFETHLRFGISLAHGYRPSSRTATVTQVAGQEVLKLDDQPAATLFARLLDRSAAELAGKHLTFSTGITLGTADPLGQHSISVVSYRTENDGLLLTQPVPPGSELTLMTADPGSSPRAGRDALRTAIVRGGITEPAVAFTAYCALRPRIIGPPSEGEIPGMCDLLAGVPLAGFCSFGEQGVADDGVSRHNNGVISVLVLGRELSHGAQVAEENSRLRRELESITSLKLTEESLRKSRDNYRLFFSTIDDLIFIGTPDGLILYTNPAVSRKLGYPSDDLLGMRILDLHPASCRTEAVEILAAMFRGERESCPLPLQKRDGTLLPVETRVWKGWWDDREVLFGISKDLSRLHAALDMFQKLFERNPSPLAISRVDTGQFVRVNEAFCANLGYAPRELIGRTSGEMGLFSDAAAQEAAALLLRETGRLDGRELTVRTKGGGLRTGIFSGAIITLQDERFFLTVMSDITERKRFEEELVRSRSLAEAASQAKSSFLATMSHELRTPLNSILGMCEVLQEELRGIVSDGQHQYLTVIEESGRHLLALINDILDLSRIEADKLEPEFAPLSVTDLCRSTLLFVREAALKRRIDLTLTLHQVPDQFLSDQRRLRQVLINLLGNAVKFTPDGGTIALEVTGAPDRQELRFTVRDTGIGIAPADLKKLFQPFVQLDTSLARRYEGTGLGLTLVARLTELLGGTVGVESEPGKGSSFTVTLPWRQREDEPHSPAILPEQPPAPPATGSFAAEPLILLADDNRASSEMVSGYLRAKGCRVLTAETGAEAVTVAGKERPDLILMDVQMPVLDGLSAIREIRGGAPPLSTVPIIALTALAMPGDRGRCLDAGADDYLEKPIAMRELLEQIRARLQASPGGS